MSTSETTYGSIDEPYDNFLERASAPIGYVSPASSDNETATTSGADNSTTPGASAAPAVSSPADLSENSLKASSVDNLTINTWIKSRNYQPKKRGFYIDGGTGYAEFVDVYVSGTIVAASGVIGGWTINPTTLSATGIVLDAGNQKISVGTGTPNIVIDGVAGTVGTSTFASGANGWRIDADGSAEFNNIVARGEFRTAVFTKDEIHATGGSFLVAPASVLLNSFTSVTTPSTSTLDLADPPSGHAALLAVNDFIRLKDGSGLDNWLKVTVVSDQTTFYRYTVDKQSGSNGTFYPGTAVINYRQSANGTILLTSDLSNSPYIDVSTTTATPWSGTTTKVRLGNLAGITDPVLGVLSGYGLWTANGYFTGSIVAAGGTIGGFNIGSDYLRDVANSFGLSSTVTSGDDVRFWAGDTYANRATAPFRVSESGFVKVRNFERDDFHLFTLFESVDGYSKAADGTGSITLGYQYVELVTGTVSGNVTALLKNLAAAFGLFTWDRDRKFKIGFNMVSGSAGLSTRMCTGFTSANEKKMGFYFSGNSGTQYTLNLQIGDGSTTTTTSLGVYNYGDFHVIEARYIHGSTNSMLFYVDGTLTQTVTSNLPTGSASAEYILDVSHSTTGGAQTLRISFMDFWQAA